MSSSALSYVYRPSTADGICAVFDQARRSGRSVGLRGAGRSYGDASLNAEGIMPGSDAHEAHFGLEPGDGHHSASSRA